MLRIGQEEIDAATRVIKNGAFFRYGFGGGGECVAFEKELAEKMGKKHALTVSSGTAALICGLAGLGIGPGDEVIVPGYTFISTALAPLAVGAIPIICDVDESLTMDAKDL